MVTLISFPTPDMLAKVKSLKQTSNRIKPCPKPCKPYFKLIPQYRKSPQGLDPAAAKPRSAAAGGRWQSERHLEFECRKCFIEHIKRPSEGWVGKCTGSWLQLFRRRAHKPVLSLSHKGGGRALPAALALHNQCLKRMDTGTSANVTNRSKKARNYLSSITSGHAYADSRVHAGLIQPGHVPDTENKAGIAGDWEHRHHSTGFSVIFWGHGRNMHLRFTALDRTLQSLVLLSARSSFPGLFGKTAQ